MSGIGALDGAEVVVHPTINQGLVCFGDEARTDAVTAALQAEARRGSATRRGTAARVMRVSVTGWSTTDAESTEPSRPWRVSLSSTH